MAITAHIRCHADLLCPLAPGFLTKTEGVACSWHVPRTNDKMPMLQGCMPPALQFTCGIPEALCMENVFDWACALPCATS